MKVFGIRTILRDGTNGWMEDLMYCLKVSDESHTPAVAIIPEDNVESLSNMHTGCDEGSRQGQPRRNWNGAGRGSGKFLADGSAPSGGDSREREREREREMDDPKYVVRRITPTEAERLMGMRDGWTDIEWKGKPAPDTARYRCLGNSMVTVVMRFIALRITDVLADN